MILRKPFQAMQCNTGMDDRTCTSNIYCQFETVVSFMVLSLYEYVQSKVANMVSINQIIYRTAPTSLAVLTIISKVCSSSSVSL